MISPSATTITAALPMGRPPGVSLLPRAGIPCRVLGTKIVSLQDPTLTQSTNNVVDLRTSPSWSQYWSACKSRDAGMSRIRGHLLDRQWVEAPAPR